MPLFDESTIAARRARFAENLGPDAPVVVVGAGQPIGKPGGHDQTFPFVPHPEHFWLTGERRPGGVVAYAPDEGFVDFAVPVSDDERLWEGEPEAPKGRDVATLAMWLSARGARDVVALGVPLESVPTSASARREHAQRALDRARRPKDDAELRIMRRAVHATTRGHARAREVIRAGVDERTIQIELEAEMFRAGAESTGYGTIVGAGTNAAVLHFTPGARVVGERDLVLVDAGAEIAGYTADVTRTFPAGARFTPEQQAIYDIVLAAQDKGIAMCRPGVEWHDVHRACAEVMARGLVELGLLKGDPVSLCEREAIALFFPHGIGHMLGLGVRDVGGRAEGRPAGRMCCGARPRVDLPLARGFIMTVEPGLYFVPAILDDAGRRARFKDDVAWETVERFRAVGAVRIEDDVLVTDGEPDVLTAAIPK